MEKIEKCAICNSTVFTDYLIVRDHLVTKCDFTISECEQCGFRFTNPRPDKQSIGAYYDNINYISHSDINKGWFNKLYHIMRQLNVKKKYRLIAKHIDFTSVLDFGCGTGYFLNYCKTQGKHAIGYEPEKHAREFASRQFNLDVKQTIKEIYDTGKYYDVITMWHVLEHIHDLDATLSKLRGLLSENGIMLVAVPNCNSYEAGIYKSDWAAYDVPRHLYHFRQNDVINFFSKQNMTALCIEGMTLDAYYISLLSEDNKTGRKRIIPALKNGILSNLKAMKTGEYSSMIYILKVKQN